MKIDVDKVNGLVTKIRQQRDHLLADIERLTAEEADLVRFLGMAQAYRIKETPALPAPKRKKVKKPNAALGSRVRAAMALQGLTMKATTKLAGCSNTTLWTLLKGESVSDDSRTKITTALGLKPNGKPIEAQRALPNGTTTAKDARFQPHKFPPQPIPEGYVSPHRRTEMIRAILANFDPDTVITARDINDKIGSSWAVPENVPALQHFSAVLMHEKGPGAALEKIEAGRWRIKPNALELVQSRVAAEIALAQEEAARHAAH